MLLNIMWAGVWVYSIGIFIVGILLYIKTYNASKEFSKQGIDYSWSTKMFFLDVLLWPIALPIYLLYFLIDIRIVRHEQQKEMQIKNYLENLEKNESEKEFDLNKEKD